MSAEVFSQGHTLDGVAADWMTRYEQHQSNAVRDLINFVLKCTGCDLQVDLQDIEDPDNASSKLTDLQDEYHALNITDYPLISRLRVNHSFRSTMTGFFQALISTAHAAGVLYNDEALIENIQVWITSMSSAAVRPFRHTATVIALSICTTMCTLAAELAENIAKTMRQKDSELKKKSVNKARVADMEAKIAEEERKRVSAENIINDIFDTVYVNRYRDIDPRVRVECVAALGNWIMVLPDSFFSGQYLRYLGWVLSDTSASTRAEVIKQLSRMFKNRENVGRLRAFTERFRPRLVEMATQDAEPAIRASTVQLLDMVREAGLLEPSDIDVIGSLIFDMEPRVRKAVAGFFAENINDLFESAVEDLGGSESLEEILGEELEDEYDRPRITWLKYICLAEVLQSYDGEEDEDGLTRSGEVVGSLGISGKESRISLAAQVILEGIPEVKEWKVLAGYLLCDLSNLSTTNPDQERVFKERCQLNEKQEILLLHMLHAAVNSALTEAIDSVTDKKGKRTKARLEESLETQQSAAIHLAQIIPQLLKKFGSNPATASAVLRLEHVLNLEIFQELRQHSTTYSALLDDINRQFLTHADQAVLAEASTALLHARSFEDLEEVTESKLQELWDENINTLHKLASDPDGEGHLETLCITIHRIANLAGISDCIAHFHSVPRTGPRKGGDLDTNIHDTLVNLLTEYHDENNSPPGETEQVNELLLSVMKCLLFYYMWHARTLHATSTTTTTTNPRPTLHQFPDYTNFSNALLAIMKSRSSIDPARLAAAGTYLDLYTLFATFRHVNHLHTEDDATPQPNVQTLVRHIPPESHSLILSIYTACERQFARKTRRTLEPAPDDPPAIDSAPEDPEDEDEEDDDGVANEHAQAVKLIAEKQLCELAGKMVLAILGRVLDYEGPYKGKVKERLERNKGKLGSNFKEVVAFLGGEKKGRGKRKAAVVKKDDSKTKKKGEKSRKMVEESDEEEADAEEAQEEDDEIQDIEDEQGDTVVLQDNDTRANGKKKTNPLSKAQKAVEAKAPRGGHNNPNLESQNPEKDPDTNDENQPSREPESSSSVSSAPASDDDHEDEVDDAANPDTEQVRPGAQEKPKPRSKPRSRSRPEPVSDVDIDVDVDDRAIDREVEDDANEDEDEDEDDIMGD